MNTQVNQPSKGGGGGARLSREGWPGNGDVRGDGGVEMMDGGDDMVLMMMVRWRGDGGEGSVSGGHRRNLAEKVEAAPEMLEREESMC
ncbi:hypothetical protein Tco_0142133 [Tanacetum coccineum]